MPNRPSSDARLSQLLDDPMVRRYWRILRALHLLRLTLCAVLILAVVNVIVQAAAR